ncbi:hypothetical protein M0R45_035546 [Rubus argutus]|uniref:Uncharacterized protein n=1 Tax=Rubus argutus TaxID=59490 RepID=A0AAW1VYV7_RUBAR
MSGSQINFLIVFYIWSHVLGKVDALRKRVVSVGKEHASLCAKSTTKKEAEARLSEGLKKVEERYIHQGKYVDDLLHIAKTLRAMPVVDLETPTLCLVGAPNVGKSSLVRILSTGKPEVCNYPFTTRGILMGHIILNHQTFQVIDTPGLLKRCDDRKQLWQLSNDCYDLHMADRNNLEKLTLAVLSHLPTAVLYVHDLSGECGTSPSDQFVIYNEIKEKFGDHLWLDVVSKFGMDRTPTMGWERVLERERDLERGNNRGKVSDGHTPRVFRIEFKIFTIQVDDLSHGGAILISEQKRERKFQLSIGLGCASWLIDQLLDVRKTKELTFFRKFSGSNSYQFWLERQNNSRGSFLRLSKCAGGFVRTIILPQGRDTEGWRLMEENLSAIVYGVPKGNLKFESLADKRLQLASKSAEAKLNYKEALQKILR